MHSTSSKIRRFLSLHIIHNKHKRTQFQISEEWLAPNSATHIIGQRPYLQYPLNPNGPKYVTPQLKCHTTMYQKMVHRLLTTFALTTPTHNRVIHLGKVLTGKNFPQSCHPYKGNSLRSLNSPYNFRRERRGISPLVSPNVVKDC